MRRGLRAWGDAASRRPGMADEEGWVRRPDAATRGCSLRLRRALPRPLPSMFSRTLCALRFAPRQLLVEPDIVEGHPAGGEAPVEGVAHARSIELADAAQRIDRFILAV